MRYTLNKNRFKIAKLKFFNKINMVTGIDPTGKIMTNHQQISSSSSPHTLAHTQLGNIANGSPNPPQSGAVNVMPEPVKRPSDTRRVRIWSITFLLSLEKLTFTAMSLLLNKNQMSGIVIKPYTFWHVRA